MNGLLKEKLEQRTKALYRAVKAQRPDLYESAVRIGHMALIDFGGRDEVKRASTVEQAAMWMAAKAAGIEFPEEPK